MANNLLDFSLYENKDSKFTAELQPRGGNITFSNSGQRGSKKYFNLSLDSFLNCLKDIKDNITKFQGHENYIEKDWRDLGNQFFSDGPANAQITVQTKPMFSTLSKIIMWANTPSIDNIDPEQSINLELSNIENAITALDQLTNKFIPNKSIESPEIHISSKSIRDFALKVFEYFYHDNWEVVFNESIIKEATINEKKYKIYDHEWFDNLIGVFDERQNKESLSSSRTSRYFEEPIYVKDGNHYYFTNQWNASGEYNLSFRNLKNFIENRFPNYRLIQDDKTFILSLKEKKKVEFIDEQQDLVVESALDEFIKWFVELEGVNHNYLKNNFSNSVEKLKSELLNYEEIYKEEFHSNVFSFDIQNKESFIENLETNLNKDIGAFHEFSSKKSTHMPRAILGKNNYLKFLKKYNFSKVSIDQIDFKSENFQKACKNSGLIFSDQLIKRFIASLWTKPFVICSGLSGSGKTKLAQAFAMWISQDKSQYEIVPVGADWTNREPLLGYPNALSNTEYVAPENGVLQLILRAQENEKLPFFLILDEMNLSHVERYFADFLSTMESGDTIPLHKIGNEKNDIPQKLKLPKNLFIIGTVNIDETTYMFSPKVLDRANTIEFRLTEDNLEDYIDSDIPLNLSKLESKGAEMAENFTEISQKPIASNLGDYKNELVDFFGELKKSGAEFGYRTTSEIGKLTSHLEALGEEGDVLLDIAIMQKLLPKLHGSRTKLSKTLVALGGFCLKDKKEIKDNYFTPFTNNEKTEKDLTSDINVKYKVSFEKICRMYKNAIENGFASYAEA